MNCRSLVVTALFGVLALCVQVCAVPALADTAGPALPPSGQMQTPPPQAPSVPQPTVPPRMPILTSDQAIQTALAHNPNVVAAREAVTAAQQNIVVARTGLAPTVSTSATGTAGTSSATSLVTSSGAVVPLPSFSTTGTASVGANLPLYDSGKTSAAVSSAEAALASAQGALRQAQQDTALSVATAFFNVLQAERLTSVREAQLAQAEAQLALSQAQVRAGVAAQSDVIQVQAQVAQAQVNLLTARSQIVTAKAALQGAIGTDVAAPVEVQEPPVPPLLVAITADAAMAAAEANRPEVAKAVALVESDQAALDLAHVSAGPQLTVGVGVGYTPYSTDPFLNNSTSYGLTATVALPLFDSGKGQAAIDAATATLHSARAQLDATRVSVRQDAYTAYLTAVQDAATVTATQAAQAAADAALQVVEGRYRAGVGTIVEVVTARATAAQAEVNAVSALYTYETALATLRHAQGVPLSAATLGGTQ